MAFDFTPQNPVCFNGKYRENPRNLADSCRIFPRCTTVSALAVFLVFFAGAPRRAKNYRQQMHRRRITRLKKFFRAEKNACQKPFGRRSSLEFTERGYTPSALPPRCGARRRRDDCGSRGSADRPSARGIPRAYRPFPPCTAPPPL